MILHDRGNPVDVWLQKTGLLKSMEQTIWFNLANERNCEKSIQKMKRYGLQKICENVSR